MNTRIIIFFIFLLTLFGFYQTQAKPKTFTNKTGYSLYKHNVENFCKEYKNTDSSSDLVYILDETSYFKEFSKNDTNILDTAIKDYRKNMDSIYSCGINISFKRQIALIKDKLLTKNASLNARMKKKLTAKIKKLEQKTKKLDGNCKISMNDTDSLIKKSILKQTTYELCKYNFYLEYLQELNNNDINILIQGGKKEGAAIEDVINKNSHLRYKIQSEIEKAYRAYPIVFQSYSDFENNIGTHILLELIREDYNTFREELHRTLNPINQVVYKISNAMKK